MMYVESSQATSGHAVIGVMDECDQGVYPVHTRKDLESKPTCWC